MSNRSHLFDRNLKIKDKIKSLMYNLNLISIKHIIHNANVLKLSRIAVLSEINRENIFYTNISLCTILLNNSPILLLKF